MRLFNLSRNLLLYTIIIFNFTSSSLNYNLSICSYLSTPTLSNLTLVTKKRFSQIHPSISQKSLFTTTLLIINRVLMTNKINLFKTDTVKVYFRNITSK